MATTSGPTQTGLRRFKDRVSRYFDRRQPHPNSDSAARSRTSAPDQDASAPIPKGIFKPTWAVVLILVTGLTCWAVASVSIWLVPVYIGIMVLLLGTPQEERPEASPTHSDSDLRTKPAVSARRSRSSAERKGVEIGPDPTGSELRLDLPGTSPESATSGPRGGKLRNPRGRSRKSTARGAPAAPAEPIPATWIRIGPGKFVRADANPGTLVDAAVQPGDVHVDPDNGPPPSLLTNSKFVPELETEPGCQGIAPSALGSLESTEPAPDLAQYTDAEPESSSVFQPEGRIEEPPADQAAGVPPDLDVKVDPPVPADDEIEGDDEVDYDAVALNHEDPGIEAVSESLVDDEFADDFSEQEVDPCDDFLQDRPIPAEDLCAPGADVAEPAIDEEYREEEQSPSDSAVDAEPSLDSRLVPSPWTTSTGSLSPRHWPRRVVRNRAAVDSSRRSRPGVPVPGPRVGSSDSRNRLHDSSLRATGRSPRNRRGYRPRSPPFRYGHGFTSSNRIV